MNTVYLIITMLVLMIVLVVLVLLFVHKKKPAAPKKTAPLKERTKVPSFEVLKARLKDKNADAQTLVDTYELLVQHYGEIKPKLGLRPNPDFDRFMALIFIVTRHPNTNKNVVIGFEKALIAKNESYRNEIEDAFLKGLSSRGM